VTRYLLAVIAGLVIVLLLGWHHVSAQNDTIDEQVKAIKQLDADRKALDQKLAARDSVDDQYQQSLKRADDEKQALVAQLNSGGRRVYVRASCPKLPNSDATSSADAGTAELDPAARQDYADLRAAIAATRIQVTGLQNYINQVCRSANGQVSRTH
jgi:prophage endopeptidase